MPTSIGCASNRSAQLGGATSDATPSAAAPAAARNPHGYIHESSGPAVKHSDVSTPADTTTAGVRHRAGRSRPTSATAAPASNSNARASVRV